MTKIKEIAEDLEYFEKYYQSSDKRYFFKAVLTVFVIFLILFFAYRSMNKLDRLERLVIGLAEEQQDFYQIVGEFENQIGSLKGLDKKELAEIRRKYKELLKNNSTSSRLIRRSLKGGEGKVYKIQLPKGYLSSKSTKFSNMSEPQKKAAKIMQQRKIGIEKDYIYVTDKDFEIVEVLNQDREYGTLKHLIDDNEEARFILDDLIDYLSKQNVRPQNSEESWQEVNDNFKPYRE